MSAPSPLALLPGLLCDGALWRAQIEGLAGRAACQVADFTSQDSMAAMAESVLAMMPGRFALAGLSMGGYVAFEVLRQAPERITRLALLDTSARPDTAEQARRRRGLIALARKGDFKGVTGRLLPLLLHPAHLEDEALAAEVEAMAGRVGRAAFLRQQTAIMTRPDSRPDLVRVACPTLVLCGRQDALTPPAWHTEIAAGIARSRLVVLEDCGHLAPMERPAEVTAALADWLAAT
jgi:pimeloyl-ACP methyl ester carboxylesterase